MMDPSFTSEHEAEGPRTAVINDFDTVLKTRVSAATLRLRTHPYRAALKAEGPVSIAASKPVASVLIGGVGF
jgi:hypothetical protein